MKKMNRFLPVLALFINSCSNDNLSSNTLGSLNDKKITNKTEISDKDFSVKALTKDYLKSKILFQLNNNNGDKLTKDLSYAMHAYPTLPAQIVSDAPEIYTRITNVNEVKAKRLSDPTFDYYISHLVANSNTQPITNGEKIVNTYTINNQQFSRTAMSDYGRFVVVWQSSGQDGSNNGIYGQRYESDGTPSGSEFRVNSYTTGEQKSPDVAMSSDGSFVVTWQSENQASSNSGYDIYAKKFDLNGNPVGNEFLVNNITTSNQSVPSIAMNSYGKFIIGWSSQDNNAQTFSDIRAKVYNADASISINEFIVENTNANEYGVKVGIGNDGAFITGYINGGKTAKIENFAANGDYTNYYTITNLVQVPVLSIGVNKTNSEFVAVWNDYDINNSYKAIYAKRFYWTGSPKDSQSKIVYTSSQFVYNPVVKVANNGDYSVAWWGDNSDIFARRFDSQGAPKAATVMVNTNTNNVQNEPSMGMSMYGNFVISWDSNYDSSDNTYNIYAKRYSTNGNSL